MYCGKRNIFFCGGVKLRTSTWNKEVKHIRMTAYAAQTAWLTQNKKQAKYKIAFKYATMVYSREKEKTGGMSTRDVSAFIIFQFQKLIRLD